MTQISFYTTKNCTEKFWQQIFAHRSSYSNSKIGWISTPKPKKTRFWRFFLSDFNRKIGSAKRRKIADKSPSQPVCRHDHTIYHVQLQRFADTALQNAKTTHNSARNNSSKTGSKIKQCLNVFWFFLKKKIGSAKMQKIYWLTNHGFDLHAAIPIRFTMFKCKGQ